MERRLFAFPINFNEEIAWEDNLIIVEIDNVTTSMLADSCAQSTVLLNKPFDNLVRGGLKAKPEEGSLRVYGNGYLPQGKLWKLSL